MAGDEWTLTTHAKRRYRRKGSSGRSGSTPVRFQYYSTVGDLDVAVKTSGQRILLRALADSITKATKNYFPGALDISVIGVGIGSLSRNKASIEQWALFAHVCEALAIEYGHVNRGISEPDLNELDVSFMKARSTQIVQPACVVTDNETNDIDVSSLLSQFSGGDPETNGCASSDSYRANAPCFLIFGFHCPPSLSCALTSLVSDRCLVVSNRVESYATSMGTDPAIKDKAQRILNGSRFHECPLISRASSRKEDRPCEEALNNMAIQTLV